MYLYILLFVVFLNSLELINKIIYSVTWDLTEIEKHGVSDRMSVSRLYFRLYEVIL